MTIQFDSAGRVAFSGFPRLAPGGGTPAMPAQQEDELWRRIGRGTWSAIGSIGSMLDVPGSMVRQTLAGEDPMTPLRDPFTSLGRASGRDVIANVASSIGAMDQHTAHAWRHGEGFNPENILMGIAGIATEVVTDPTFWFTFGGAALTKKGRALRAIGGEEDFLRVMREKTKLPDLGRRQAQLKGTLRDLVDHAPELKKRYMPRVMEYAKQNAFEVNDLLNSPLGTLAGFRIPFSGGQVAPIGGGNVSARSAALMDATYQVLRYNRVSQGVASMLGYRMRGVGSPHSRLGGRADIAQYASEVGTSPGTVVRRGQEYAGRVTDDSVRALADARAGEVFDILQGMQQNSLMDPRVISETLGIPMQEAREAVIELGLRSRRYLETTKKIAEKGMGHQGAIDRLASTQAGRLLLDEHQQALDWFRKDAESWLNRLQGSGATVQQAEDISRGILEGYSQRLRQSIPGRMRKKGVTSAYDRLTDVHKSFFEQRSSALTGFEGGAYAIDSLAMHFPYSGAVHRGKDTAGRAMQRAGQKLTPREIKELAAREMLKPEWQELIYQGKQAIHPLKERQQKAYELASHVIKFDPVHADKVLPVFDYNPVATALGYREAASQTIAALDGVQGFMLENVAPWGRAGHIKAEKVWDVYGGIKGADQKRSAELFVSKLARTNQGKSVLAQAQRDMQAAAKKTLTKKQLNNPTRLAQNLFVPPDVAETAKKSVMAFTEPESMHWLIQTMDWYTKRWKAGMTILFPAFHGRNLISGQIRNWAAGFWSADTIADADQLLRKGMITNARRKYPAIAENLTKRGVKNVDDQAVSRAIQERLFSERVLTHRAGQAGEVLRARDAATEIPGVARIFPERLPGTDILGHMHPFYEGGVAQRAGAAGSYYIEGLNRISPFLNMTKKGWSGEAAARTVELLQVNYSKVSDFHRNVVKRVFPFSTFQLGVVPWTVKSLMEQPGGRMAQIAKGTARLRSSEAILPEEVQRTAAIPIPPSPGSPDVKRYLASLGQMEEPFYAMAAPLLRLPERPYEASSELVREMAGHLHPLARMLPELASQRSMFFGGAEPGGREIRTLDPPIGRAVQNMRQLMRGETDRQVAHPLGIPGTGDKGRFVEYIHASLPGARLISTLGQLTRQDVPLYERLAQQAALRFQRVTPERAETLRKEQLDRAMMRLTGGRGRISLATIPDYVKEDMTQDELRHAQELEALRSVLQSRIRTRRR